jgi:hypothetical protein
MGSSMRWNPLILRRIKYTNSTILRINKKCSAAIMLGVGVLTFLALLLQESGGGRGGRVGAPERGEGVGE